MEHTELDLNYFERADREATPAPWDHNGEKKIFAPAIHDPGWFGNPPHIADIDLSDNEAIANRHLIILMRNNWAALVQDLQAAQTLNEQLLATIQVLEAETKTTKTFLTKVREGLKKIPHNLIAKALFAEVAHYVGEGLMPKRKTPVLRT